MDCSGFLKPYIFIEFSDLIFFECWSERIEWHFCLELYLNPFISFSTSSIHSALLLWSLLSYILLQNCLSHSYSVVGMSLDLFLQLADKIVVRCFGNPVLSVLFDSILVSLLFPLPFELFSQVVSFVFIIRFLFVFVCFFRPNIFMNFSSV